MLFAAYIGTDTGLPAWCDAVQRHAAWLGLTSREASHALEDGRVFAFAGQDAILPYGPEYLLLGTSDGILPSQDVKTTEALRQWLTDEQPPVEIRIGVSLHTGELLAAVPPCSVEQLCFATIPGGWALSDDLRFLARLVGAELDEVSVYGLFRHGIVLSPMTLFKRIQCVPGGHLLRIAPDSEAPSLEVYFHLSPPAGGEPQPALAEAKVRDILDEILATAPLSSIVHFSGGMDSSLVAARLAAMGRKDVTLVNYAFGPQDAAGKKALKIAAHLGLRCEQIMWDPAGIPAVLGRLGKDYPAPFSDPSLVPGNLLAHASLPLVEKSRTTIHAVGTGGLFSQRLQLREKLKPLYDIPVPLRRAAGGAYRWFRLWHRDSETERALGFLRRTLEGPTTTPPRAGVHPMDGIAYKVPEAVSACLSDTLRYHAQAFVGGRKTVEGTLGMALYMQRQLSAITAGPLGARGARAFGAFTEPRMLRCALSLQLEEKCPGGLPRGVLHNLLARSLPSEWIYGPGGSFLAPFEEIYAHPAMRQLANDVVLSRQNPLLGFCNARVVKEMLMRTMGGQPVCIRARKFLWTFVFASGWLYQINREM